MTLSITLDWSWCKWSVRWGQYLRKAFWHESPFEKLNYLSWTWFCYAQWKILCRKLPYCVLLTWILWLNSRLVTILKAGLKQFLRFFFFVEILRSRFDLRSWNFWKFIRIKIGWQICVHIYAVVLSRVIIAFIFVRLVVPPLMSKHGYFRNLVCLVWNQIMYSYTYSFL